MNDQKLENLLNLALNATKEERIRSGNLNVGYDAEDRTWEVIIKYTKTLDEVRRIAESVTELFGGFAILRIKEAALGRLTEIPQVTYASSLSSHCLSSSGGVADRARLPAVSAAGARFCFSAITGFSLVLH